MQFGLLDNLRAETTLANLLLDELSLNEKPEIFNIDGDDLRNLFQNKDYSRKGREAKS